MTTATHYTYDVEIEDALVVSVHDLPQVSPQEWDCGCVTECYATDRDGLRGEQPFEMRLVHFCGKKMCCVWWEIPPPIGAIYRAVNNTTGRRWCVWREEGVRSVKLIPLGGDWGHGGGVKAITVSIDRLHNPRFWQRLAA